MSENGICVSGASAGISRTGAGGQPQSPKNSRARLISTIPERVCDYCGEFFTPYREWQRFCGQGKGCKRNYERRNPPTSETRPAKPTRVRKSLLCPECKARDSLVIDARGCRGFVWRRRRCQACQATFTTRESVVERKKGAQ